MLRCKRSGKVLTFRVFPQPNATVALKCNSIMHLRSTHATDATIITELTHIPRRLCFIFRSQPTSLDVFVSYLGAYPHPKTSLFHI